MRIAAAETFMLGHEPLPTSLRRLEAAGFDSVEIIVPHRIAADASPAEIAAVQGELANSALDLVALSGGWPLAACDEDRRAAGVAELRSVIALAERLGCATVTSEINGGTSDAETECIDAFRKSIEQLTSQLETTGVHLALEPHPGDVVERHDDGLALIREINHPSVGYLYCLPHTFVLGEDAAKMIREAGTLLSYVHVADSNRQQKIVVGYRTKGYANALETDEFRDTMTAHEHLVPGKGDIDFVAVSEALRDIAYDGVLSAVPFAIQSDLELEHVQQALRSL
ncbi:MAG TPA: sugar phosphate isomerase/epimerase [Dermatophilaceae bacterium]|jgi:sugar phosphate isomerase/epimerase